MGRRSFSASLRVDSIPLVPALASFCFRHSLTEGVRLQGADFGLDRCNVCAFFMLWLDMV